jgi:hypothetical protein
VDTAFNPWTIYLLNNSTEDGYVNTGHLADYPSNVDLSSDTTANALSFYIPRGIGLILVPFGVGSDGHTFDIQVRYWRKANDGTNTGVYGIVAWEGTITLGTTPGVASTPVDENQDFAKTVAKAAGISGSSEMSDTVASQIQIDNLGYTVCSIEFDKSAATSGNVLVSSY